MVLENMIQKCRKRCLKQIRNTLFKFSKTMIFFLFWCFFLNSLGNLLWPVGSYVNFVRPVLNQNQHVNIQTNNERMKKIFVPIRSLVCVSNLEEKTILLTQFATVASWLKKLVMNVMHCLYIYKLYHVRYSRRPGGEVTCFQMVLRSPN